ncbi:MAG: glutamate--tRNA ligase [Marinilabiliales bacterium]|nr:MAG: glutamate--tRNA ligase [Marinilabiliales bacterium]
MSHTQIRVRFAPSPTGPLHIGGVRTALYNYLFAKKNKGTFILRIEDTDQTRYVEGAERYIMDSLKWSGIQIDEGIEQGGDFGPYRQSERKEIYKEYAMQLIEAGKAYYAFDSPEELDQMRKKLEEEKAANTSYNPSIRLQMRNSLSMSKQEVVQLIENGTPYVIRFKTPENETIEMNDLVRGNVKFHSSTLDDKVLYKSDGMPTYHLANVVDDYLMKISHVIRGEEWLPSLPLHVQLYDALGWKNEMPEFAHLPLLLKPSGNGKLSKRDGDKLGFPVFPMQWTDPKSGDISAGYKEDGYFPEAFINMLALLGWNPGTEQELFSMDELMDEFSIEKVSKSGARFDPQKARWFNHAYMQKKENSFLAKELETILEQKAVKNNQLDLEKICSMVKERAELIPELWDQSFFFFEAPEEYDEKFLKKKWKDNTSEIIKNVADVLNGIESFQKEEIEKQIKDHLEKQELGFGQVMPHLRVAIVGKPMGPDMFDILSIIGKEESLKRISAILNRVN